MALPTSPWKLRWRAGAPPTDDIEEERLIEGVIAPRVRGPAFTMGFTSPAGKVSPPTAPLKALSRVAARRVGRDPGTLVLDGASSRRVGRWPFTAVRIASSVLPLRGELGADVPAAKL
eukprot:scaffold260989_cov32-Tisochrysis_lutea.AAC.3